MKIIGLSIGEPKTIEYRGKPFTTGIQKKQVDEAFLSYNGFQKDGVANTDFHGGPDRAVCVYPYERYHYWNRIYGRSLSIPAFGENLTVEGLTEDKVFIGDTFHIGETIVQVTQGRIPCATISKNNNESDLLKKVVETGFTGYFLKVIKGGWVTKDSSITLVNRLSEQWDILKCNDILFHNNGKKEEVERLSKLKELAPQWNGALLKKYSLK
ncbi:MOSC domain-containing protein [Rossellomorea sp. BNER]|uniref:MOSC domain-containing protein n=1 Tax=Rossellomorea sp. BNER TaxID=2962031 RepID=UPI003AF2F2FB|nr:MOSC domain-containing protein [Rossellomorea sp. BNER]